MRSLGFNVRIGDPALPLLRDNAQLDVRTSELLQFDEIKRLPDAVAGVESPNLRLWAHRLLPVALAAGLSAKIYSSASRKSTPISSTARKFLR